MWPFTRKPKVKSEIKANSVVIENGVATIDVRGQTCPGYLLAINKAVESLPDGTSAKLVIAYPPCGDDVGAWCKAREIKYLGISESDGVWVIEIRK
jgi:TusA-related sulfurtransferase